MKKKTALSASTPRAKAEHGTSLLTAFREIRELIVHGRLSPGTWILEAELAERLNMSRTPVRAAFRILADEGLVTLTKNSTTVVSARNGNDVIEKRLENQVSAA